MSPMFNLLIDIFVIIVYQILCFREETDTSEISGIHNYLKWVGKSFQQNSPLSPLQQNSPLSPFQQNSPLLPYNNLRENKHTKRGLTPEQFSDSIRSSLKRLPVLRMVVTS